MADPSPALLAQVDPLNPYLRWEEFLPNVEDGSFSEIRAIELRAGDIFVLDSFTYKVLAPMPRRSREPMIFNVATYSHLYLRWVLAQIHLPPYVPVHVKM